MNCPMCGAPLGDNDTECSRCFTKRSEMGPAYNTIGSQDNGGSGYGNNGYNNGNAGFGSADNYGRSSNNYGGMSSSGTGSITKGQMTGVVIFILGLLAVVYFVLIRPSTFRTYDAGDFKVKLPVDCKKLSTVDLGLDSMTDPGSYRNKDMRFEYAYMYPSYFQLEEGNMNAFKDNAIALLDDQYSRVFDYSHYTKISSAYDTLKFKFDAGGRMTYVEIRLVYKDDGAYVFVCKCTEADMSKMEGKFSKIFDSIKFK